MVSQSPIFNLSLLMAAKSRTISGAWFVLLAATLWGTTGTAQTFAPAGTSPLAVGTVRMVLGGALLAGLMFARGGWRHGGRWPIVPLVLAVLGMVGYQLLFFAGVARAGVAMGTIVGIGSSPIMAGLLTWIVFRTWPGRQWAIADRFGDCGLHAAHRRRPKHSGRCGRDAVGGGRRRGVCGVYHCQ